ncbi:histidine kinase dimerization/phospho-acceptor domain-containing protein [Halobacteriovorax sp.]|uniref:histidine kinase dimerization/phospho-acceptor domain-containing protein n=1 Tax=Halobacteriovorax sp. TaxID=2020862 RepID=UPI003AF1E9E9
MCLISLYTYKKYDNLLTYRVLLFITAFVILNYRIYVMQSHSTELLTWILAFFIVMVYTTSFRVAIIILISNLSLIAYNTQYGEAYVWLLPLKYQLVIHKIYPTLIIAFTLLYKKLSEVARTKELESFNKRDVISKMIITLSHEINNPLAIAKLTVNKLKRESAKSILKKIDKNLDKISNITHLMKDINDLKEVEHGDRKIFDLYSATNTRDKSAKT